MMAAMSVTVGDYRDLKTEPGMWYARGSWGGSTSSPWGSSVLRHLCWRATNQPDPVLSARVFNEEERDDLLAVAGGGTTAPTLAEWLQEGGATPRQSHYLILGYLHASQQSLQHAVERASGLAAAGRAGDDVWPDLYLQGSVFGAAWMTVPPPLDQIEGSEWSCPFDVVVRAEGQAWAQVGDGDDEFVHEYTMGRYVIGQGLLSEATRRHHRWNTPIDHSPQARGFVQAWAERLAAARVVMATHAEVEFAWLLRVSYLMSTMGLPNDSPPPPAVYCRLPAAQDPCDLRPVFAAEGTPVGGRCGVVDHTPVGLRHRASVEAKEERQQDLSVAPASFASPPPEPRSGMGRPPTSQGPPSRQDLLRRRAEEQAMARGETGGLFSDGPSPTPMVEFARLLDERMMDLMSQLDLRAATREQAQDQRMEDRQHEQDRRFEARLVAVEEAMAALRGPRLREAVGERRASLSPPRGGAREAPPDPREIQLRAAHLEAQTQETKHLIKEWDLLLKPCTWLKGCSAETTRGAMAGKVLFPRGGTRWYLHAGTPGVAWDLVNMFLSSEHWAGDSDDPRRPPRVHASGRQLPGPALAKYGLTSGDDHTCLEDFQLPTGRGSDALEFTPAMFATAPRARTPIKDILAFEAAVRACAWSLKAFWGERYGWELEQTLQGVIDYHHRLPFELTAARAAALVNRLLQCFFSTAVVLGGSAMAPPLYRACPLPERFYAQYELKGWAQDGPSLYVTMEGDFAEQHFRVPMRHEMQEALARLQKLGKGGIPRSWPTGGDEYLPLEEKPGPLGVDVATCKRATSQLLKLKLVPDSRPMCFRVLSAAGCPQDASGSCRFVHHVLATPDLRRAYQAGGAFKAVMDRLGGLRASTSERPSLGEALEDSTLGAGGASGAVDVQVPFLALLPDWYPKAPRTDARSQVVTGPVPRPSTTHLDCPPVPYGGPGGLSALQQLPLSRAGAALFWVSEPGDQGVFTCRLGSLQWKGRELGQRLFVREAMPPQHIDHACVFLTFADMLQLDASTLFSDTTARAYEAVATLGEPSAAEGPVQVFLRILAHDLGSACNRGHAIDALSFLYLPPPALDHVVVVMIHHAGSEVAMDVIHGRSAGPDARWLYCLQRRGQPGHLRPLDPPSATGAAVLEYAAKAGVPIRHLTALGWQDYTALTAEGLSQPWLAHATCDVCHQPRSPLPPCPVLL
jgi:hypothetical protein